MQREKLFGGSFQRLGSGGQSDGGMVDHLGGIPNNSDQRDVLSQVPFRNGDTYITWFQTLNLAVTAVTRSSIGGIGLATGRTSLPSRNSWMNGSNHL
jgi:hypothetical protein